jgi:hypothetical protein
MMKSGAGAPGSAANLAGCELLADSGREQFNELNRAVGVREKLTVRPQVKRRTRRRTRDRHQTARNDDHSTEGESTCAPHGKILHSAWFPGTGRNAPGLREDDARRSGTNGAPPAPLECPFMIAILRSRTVSSRQPPHAMNEKGP